MEQDTKILVETLLARREGLRTEEIQLDQAKAQIAKERKLIDQHLGLLGIETGKQVVVSRGEHRTPRESGQLNQQEALRVLRAADRPLTAAELYAQGQFTSSKDGVKYTLARLTETGQVEAVTETSPTGGRPARKYRASEVAHAA